MTNTIVPGAGLSLRAKAFLYAQSIFISFHETAGSVPFHTLESLSGLLSFSKTMENA